MYLHWHRRDLRAADNRGLTAATEDGILPVFVFDSDVLEHAAPPRVSFLLDALDWLQDWYRDRGSDLVWVRGDPVEELPRLASEYGADSVVWNHDYSGLAQERDAAVQEALDGAGLEHEQYHDAVHHGPGSITTNDGDPYAVFSYFGEKWLDREKNDPFPAPVPEILVSATDEGNELPTHDELGFNEPNADLPAAGTEAARERLESFCAEDIYRYGEAREYPARGATSRLSQDLKYGTIGIREVTERVATAMEEAESQEDRESVDTYREELAWREFYAQVLYFNPFVVTQNYKTYENEIEWRADEDELRAWKEGRTGYPIVDAGMRQLHEEAYMHNRMRMVVASFLTKDLLIDWREGYDWFRKRLVDHDTGNDNGGWQWAASTGTDAQPYFRIFNPMTQGERYDPDAEYIQEYVPELQEVDSETIHSWHDLDDERRAAVAPDYPTPIVNHTERREAALAMFEHARGESQ